MVGWLHPGIRRWSGRQKKPAAGATQPRMLPIAALLVSGFAHHATRHLPARAAFPPRGAFPIPTVVADGQASTTVVDSGVRPDHHMMDTTAGAASTRALSVIMKSSDLTDTSAFTASVLRILGFTAMASSIMAQPDPDPDPDPDPYPGQVAAFRGCFRATFYLSSCLLITTGDWHFAPMFCTTWTVLTVSEAAEKSEEVAVFMVTVAAALLLTTAVAAGLR